MIKVSKMADYAVVILGALEGEGPDLANAGAIALKTRLPEPTVAKVLKMLAKETIVESVRGANGGYRLARKPADITIAEIINAIDGPVALAACVEGAEGCCDLHAYCLVKGRWDDVNHAIRAALENITLAEMTGPRPNMKKAVNA